VKRFRVFTGLILLALLGCGDPLLVFGDLPGFMRIIVGIPGRAGEQVGQPGTATELNTPVGVAQSTRGCNGRFAGDPDR
jgi:hypothetical protein